MMQLMIYLVIFVTFYCHEGMQLQCHQCAISSSKMDMSLEQCRTSDDINKCLSSFTKCYQRIAVKKDKATNKTETVISNGCGNDMFCARLCEPLFFSGYDVVSCNLTCCNTTLCNDYRLPVTTPIANMVTTVVTTTTPPIVTNATLKSVIPTTNSCNGNQAMKNSVVLVIISMVMLFCLNL